MKRLPVIIALGAIALTANGASAQPNRAHVGKTSHTVMNAYGYARHAAPQGPILDQHVFESNSLGHQSFPNPDRQLPSVQSGGGF